MVPGCDVSAPQAPHAPSCLGRGGCQQLAQRCQRLGKNTIVTVLLGYAHSLIQCQQSLLQGRAPTGAKHRLTSTSQRLLSPLTGQQGCTTGRHSLTIWHLQ